MKRRLSVSEVEGQEEEEEANTRDFFKLLPQDMRQRIFASVREDVSPVFLGLLRLVCKQWALDIAPSSSSSSSSTGKRALDELLLYGVQSRSVTICKHARSWGATDFESMYSAATASEQSYLGLGDMLNPCARLAEKWLAKRCILCTGEISKFQEARQCPKCAVAWCFVCETVLQDEPCCNAKRCPRGRCAPNVRCHSCSSELCVQCALTCFQCFRCSCLSCLDSTMTCHICQLNNTARTFLLS